MAELRKMRKVGGSLTLTIPKDMGFVDGDWIKIEKNGDLVVLKKVVV